MYTIFRLVYNIVMDMLVQCHHVESCESITIMMIKIILLPVSMSGYLPKYLFNVAVFPTAAETFINYAIIMHGIIIFGTYLDLRLRQLQNDMYT